MIKALFSYYYKDYYRSHKYIAPVIFYITCILIIFSQRNIDIMSVYSLSAIFIYFFSAWITFGFMEVEDSTQQQLTILHSKDVRVYYFTKISFIWCFTLCFAILTIAYPILRGLFSRTITITDIAIAFTGHALMGLMGITLAVLFNSRLVKDRRTAVTNLFAVLLVSSLQIVIIQRYPILKYVVMLLPPVSYASDSMAFYDYADLSNIGSVLLTFMGLVIYSVILLILYIKLMKKKRF